jgi:hypothetical protein
MLHSFNILVRELEVPIVGYVERLVIFQFCVTRILLQVDLHVFPLLQHILSNPKIPYVIATLQCLRSGSIMPRRYNSEP